MLPQGSIAYRIAPVDEPHLIGIGQCLEPRGDAGEDHRFIERARQGLANLPLGGGPKRAAAVEKKRFVTVLRSIIRTNHHVRPPGVRTFSSASYSSSAREPRASRRSASQHPVCDGLFLRLRESTLTRMFVPLVHLSANETVEGQRS